MSARARVLRRAMSRVRIDDDIVRHLTTVERLGEHLEVGSPGELPPVGARTLRRALRTRAVAQVGADWVWPHWLERQLDPTSPSFVPGGHLPFLSNVTARNWTMVGNIGSPHEAIVDGRGLVTPRYDGWSLDWWVGAEDRWHLPSREVAVRQRLVDDAPVVETAMRVPGGDLLHRTYAIRTAAADGGQELLVVEVENATPVPVALAMAIRPCNPEGLAVVERIGLHGRGPGKVTVTVDGRAAVLLPRAPNRVAGSTFRDGDVATIVLGGEAGTALSDGLRCEAGLASAAFVYPLPHRATMSFLLPLAPPEPARRWWPVGRRREPVATVAPRSVPTADQVANGWRGHAGRGLRLVIPDPRLTAAVEANRRFLLLLHDGDDITPGPATSHRFGFRDAAYLLGALDRYGYAEEVAEVLASYPDRQRGDGLFLSQSKEGDANGAALHAIGEHWRLHRSAADLEGLAPVVAAGIEWIERARAGRPAGRGRRSHDGLLPAGVSAEHLGPFDVHYWDDLWCLKGMLDGAAVLDALGEVDAGTDARAGAARFRSDIDASLASVASRLGTLAMPAGPSRRIDHAAIGSLAACWPLRLMDGHDPRIEATADVVRERFCQGPAFFEGISHTGLGTSLTLLLALVELEVGDRRALERLDWLLSVATPTWTWPEAVHPLVGGGCMGDGHHGVVAADLLTLVRNLLVRESMDGGLALCSIVPDGWLGQPLEVHDAPTHHGLLSFAIRWHGDRPALLWELAPHDGTTAVRITAPGLDPAWSTTELRGDALLAPVAPPTPPEPEVPPPQAPMPEPTLPPDTPVQLSPRRPRRA